MLKRAKDVDMEDVLIGDEEFVSTGRDSHRQSTFSIAILADNVPSGKGHHRFVFRQGCIIERLCASYADITTAPLFCTRLPTLNGLKYFCVEHR